jgi:hypothetical protein
MLVLPWEVDTHCIIMPATATRHTRHATRHTPQQQQQPQQQHKVAEHGAVRDSTQESGLARMILIPGTEKGARVR